MMRSVVVGVLACGVLGPSVVGCSSATHDGAGRGVAGAPSIGGAASSIAGGVASGGGVTSGVGGGPGGTAVGGAAANPARPDDARIALDPKTKGGACFLYGYEYCVRLATCGGRPTSTCFTFGNDCPDLTFSEGSTRSVESVVACARAWSTFPCAELAKGKSPECATPGTKVLGEQCLYSSQCSSLACESQYRGECGKCVETVAVGEACVGTSGCSGSASCNTTTMTCKAPTVVPALGDVCTSSCSGYAYCSPDSRCVAFPNTGEACGNGRLCRTGDYCRKSDNTCQVRPDAPAACGIDIDDYQVCSDRSDCVNDVCVIRPSIGQPCTTTNRCAPGAFCDSVEAGVPGTCRSAGKGEPCVSSDRICQANLGCDAGTCKDLVGPEMPCGDGNTTCVLGECDGTTCVVPDATPLFKRACN